MPPLVQDCAERQARPGQVRGGYLLSHGGYPVGHPARVGLRVRAAAGLLLQLCVWVTLHPIISGAWIVVLSGGREGQKGHPSLCSCGVCLRKGSPSEGNGMFRASVC